MILFSLVLTCQMNIYNDNKKDGISCNSKLRTQKIEIIGKDLFSPSTHEKESLLLEADGSDQ